MLVENRYWSTGSDWVWCQQFTFKFGGFAGEGYVLSTLVSFLYVWSYFKRKRKINLKNYTNLKRAVCYSHCFSVLGRNLYYKVIHSSLKKRTATKSSRCGCFREDKNLWLPYKFFHAHRSSDIFYSSNEFCHLFFSISVSISPRFSTLLMYGFNNTSILF